MSNTGREGRSPGTAAPVDAGALHRSVCLRSRSLAATVSEALSGDNNFGGRADRETRALRASLLRRTMFIEHDGSVASPAGSGADQHCLFALAPRRLGRSGAAHGTGAIEGMPSNEQLEAAAAMLAGRVGRAGTSTVAGTRVPGRTVVLELVGTAAKRLYSFIFDDDLGGGMKNRSSERRGDCTANHHLSVQNGGLMVECIRMILDHAAAESDGQATLLYCTGDGPHTLAEFCRLAASKSLAASGENSAEDTALCETLSRLPQDGLDLLLRTMLVAGRAKLNDDGDIVELLPKHTATAVAVDEVDVGIFKLRASLTALERRIERLSEKAGVCGARAVLAKKEGQKNLCLVHLKRRKMCKDEIDRTSASLLNVERQLHVLERTRADADVIQALKLARDAMNMAHKSEEEGGKGLHPEDVKQLMDEMANLTEESNEVTKMIIDAGVASGVGEISEEELEQELEALKDADVDVDDLANILASTGLEDNSAGEKTSTNHAEAVAEEATKVAGGNASVARGSTGSMQDEEVICPKKSGLVAL